MIIGAHGTNFDSIELIKETNFIESIAKDDWLGNGAYFFVDGCSDETPLELAMKWAVASSWDNDRKCNTYSHAGCFEVQISYDEKLILDLTIPQGMKLLNKFRDKVKETLYDAKRARFKKELSDAHILNSMRERIKIELVKAHVYIKFTEERKFQLQSRIPNCTIIAVNNTAQNIDTTTIQNVKKKELEVKNGL